MRHIRLAARNTVCILEQSLANFFFKGWIINLLPSGFCCQCSVKATIDNR